MSFPAPSLSVRVERWPIAGSFAISRGAKTEAVVVVAELSDGLHRGRGECVPYARYGETVAGVSPPSKLWRAISPEVSAASTCKLQWRPAQRATHSTAHSGISPPSGPASPFTSFSAFLHRNRSSTAYTISLATPDAMAQAAAKAAGPRPSQDQARRHRRPRAHCGRSGSAAPRSELIVDANEGWTPEDLADNLRACAQAGVTLVEQPLPAGRDEALAHLARPVAVCADESVHSTASLAALVGRYDAVNIKLDKTGGLSEALTMTREAERLGFTLMIGCMVATSLAMAPAMFVAQRARIVDLDGALLLARDRPNGLRYEGSMVHPPRSALWG